MAEHRSPEQLLREYTPILVMLPQDFTRPKPKKPWWWSPSRIPRGDYHPCSVRFFLSHVYLRTTGRRPWDFVFARAKKPTGLKQIRKHVAGHHASNSLDWELDIGPIRSQRPTRAWRTYRDLVSAYYTTQPFQPHAYGRCVTYRDRFALQYWYLYVYNDAGNVHEADWEMVTLELDRGGSPVRAGYSGHASGMQRPWERVERRGNSPLVYVARGSHAAYFEHRKNGHLTRSFRPPTKVPWPFNLGIMMLQNLIVGVFSLLGWKDYTAANPLFLAEDDWNRGVLVDTKLHILPRIDRADPRKHWWMKLRCRWGSSHIRITGFRGPPPPWERSPEWDDPVAWIDSLP